MSYLTEAFKALDALNEDTFSVSDDGIKKLAEFEDNDDLVDEITVYDADAEDTEDLEDSYVGKVIVDCNVCHSKIYKDKSDVVIDEETQNANIDEECPYCYSTDGFKVIGEVAPMTTETEEKVEVKDDLDESLNEATEMIPSPWNTYLEISDYTPDAESGEYQIGDTIEGNTILAYLDPKERYEDIIDTFMLLFRSPEGKNFVGTTLKGRVYPSSIEDFSQLKKVDDESLKESVDLLTKENTIASVLSKHMDELSEYTDANSMRNAIIDILDKSEIADKDSVKKLKRVLFTKKSTGALLSTIATYMTGEKVAKVGRRDARRKAVNENIGTDIDEYQQWVDYDMKRYGKISDQTNKEIKEAGLQVVKDKYGDYQVIAGKYDESLKESTNSDITKLEDGVYQYRSVWLPGIGDKKEVSIIYFNELNNVDIVDINELNDDIVDTAKPVYDIEVTVDGHFLDETKLARAIGCISNPYLTGFDYDSAIYWCEKISDYFKGLDSDNLTNELIDLGLNKNAAIKMFGEERASVNEEKSHNNYDSMSGEDLIDHKVDDLKKEYNHSSESLKESVKDVTITTDDSKTTMTSEDDGKVTVTTEPVEEHKDDEVIEPLTDETEAEIEANDGEEDVDIEDFDEESFDELGEGYFKNVYENVNSFKTSNITTEDNKVIVEGVITFDNNVKKNTSFLFESANKTKNGKYRFIGENLNVTKGNKAFSLIGNVTDKKFLSESMNYNYRTKNDIGKFIRCCGTIKRG